MKPWITVAVVAMVLTACGTPDEVEDAAKLVIGHAATYKAQLEALAKAANQHRQEHAGRLAYVQDDTANLEARRKGISSAWGVRNDKDAKRMLAALRNDARPPPTISALSESFRSTFGQTKFSIKELGDAIKNIKKGVEAASPAKNLETITPFVTVLMNTILKDESVAPAAVMGDAGTTAKAATESLGDAPK